MAFKDKTDWFGLAGNGLVVVEDDDGRAASTAQAHNEKGDVVAFEVFGETMSPTCTYNLSSNVSMGSLKCGQPFTVGDKKFTLGQLTINTTAGSAPTVQASGEQIPSTSISSDCTYTFPAATLKACFHAQILWNAFTLAGEGCYLQQANYTAGGSVARATKNGETIAYDVVDGMLQVQLQITQTGNVAPTVTPGEDWTITAPLACSNADEDYPQWSCTLSRYLLHDA